MRMSDWSSDVCSSDLTATSSRWVRFSDSLTRSAPEFILAGERQWRRFLSHDLALSATELVKKFGGRRVVDGVDIAVQKGVIYGVIGPNGAGKTTTPRMLLGSIEPDASERATLGRNR